MGQASALLEPQEITALGCGQVNHIVRGVSGQVQAQKGTQHFTASASVVCYTTLYYTALHYTLPMLTHILLSYSSSPHSILHIPPCYIMYQLSSIRISTLTLYCNH